MLFDVSITDGSHAYFCDDGACFRVDSADREIVGDYNWSVRAMGSVHCRYVIRGGKPPKGGLYLLHREIMQPPDAMVVDHIDGDATNNCRANLRVCTVQQNRSNVLFPSRGPSKSKYRGVHPMPSGRFEALISIAGKMRSLGTYDTEEEAARVWDKAARNARGAFTFQNFP